MSLIVVRVKRNNTGTSFTVRTEKESLTLVGGALYTEVDIYQIITKLSEKSVL